VEIHQQVLQMQIQEQEVEVELQLQEVLHQVVLVGMEEQVQQIQFQEVQ
jgi:hypothetical protein